MKPLSRLLPLPPEQVDQIHRTLYILGLMTIACGLAWSNALMSIGQFILAGNWLLEGDFVAKLQRSKQQRHLGLLLSIFGLVLIGFLWSDNIGYALKDARIKFPLFLLPLFIGTTERLKKKEIRLIFGVYLITLILLYLTSLAKSFGIFSDTPIGDKRELSIFISHIRYGLNLLLGALIAIHFSKLLLNKRNPDLVPERSRRTGLWTLASAPNILAVLLFSSLVILELYTALLIGFLIASVYILKLILFGKLKLYLKLSVFVLVLVVAGIGLFQIRQVYTDFHSLPEMSYDQNLLMGYSPAGNPYFHKENDLRKENGVYLYRYLQEKELAKSWDERSQIAYEGEDQKGNPIRKTLIRFLSSKGLTKDSAGMAELNEEEIKAIEQGVPNRYYLDHYPLQNRMYTTLYELEMYSDFGYAEGFSLGMRLEFWKTAKRIIEKQPLMGVGTGDVQDAFDMQYHMDKTSLSEKNRRRAHNQYLTIWLTYGIFGMIFFLFYLLWPLRGNWNSFYPAFLAIAMLSFLTEDTLETQAGVTFFAFFNALFVLGMPQESNSR